MVRCSVAASPRPVPHLRVRHRWISSPQSGVEGASIDCIVSLDDRPDRGHPGPAIPDAPTWGDPSESIDLNVPIVCSLAWSGVREGQRGQIPHG